MPGASAQGRSAQRPIKSVGTTAAKIVPMMSAVWFRPAACKIAVLTKMMYDIVTKVVSPARNSVRCVLPRCDGLSSASSHPALDGAPVALVVGGVVVVSMKRVLLDDVR